MTRLTVIAGPTAVGKGTVVRKIIEMHPEIGVSISVTTRTARPDEIDGVHYFFVDD
ncbi:MAG: guanylate kinase, partial [Microbacteriaceae bacterium]|nr:guanylate kinase [Microbacteriaceae bacterium]